MGRYLVELNICFSWSKMKNCWSNVMQKGFESEPVYDNKYLKTKTKSCYDKINANFHDNEIPKEGSHCACLSVISMDSVFKMGKNYYLLVFLKECI